MTPEPTQASRSLMDVLFEQAGVGLCLVGSDGIVVRANAEWLRSTGYTADEAIGADIIELFPETRDMALAMHARARAGHWVQVPSHAQRVNGHETWWEGSIAPVRMDDGVGLLITARDITERMTPGQEPFDAHLHALYHALFEHCVDAVLLTKVDGTILRANPAACRAYGLSEREIRRPGRAERVVDDSALREFLAERARNGAARSELTGRRGDGTLVPLEATSAVIMTRDGERYAYIVLRDVTDRKGGKEERRAGALSGLLPICAWCKKVRTESGCWQQIEAFVSERSEARFTHAMCPDCFSRGRGEGEIG